MSTKSILFSRLSIIPFTALSSKGHALRRQKKEDERKARESQRGFGKRKMAEDQVRAEANKMGATVAGTAAEEVNGFHVNVDDTDDLSGPAPARQASGAPPAKVPKPNAAASASANDGLPATKPFDWSKVASVSLTLHNTSISHVNAILNDSK